MSSKRDLELSVVTTGNNSGHASRHHTDSEDEGSGSDVPILTPKTATRVTRRQSGMSNQQGAGAINYLVEEPTPAVVLPVEDDGAGSRGRSVNFTDINNALKQGLVQAVSMATEPIQPGPEFDWRRHVRTPSLQQQKQHDLDEVSSIGTPYEAFTPGPLPLPVNGQVSRLSVISNQADNLPPSYPSTEALSSALAKPAMTNYNTVDWMSSRYRAKEMETKILNRFIRLGCAGKILRWAFVMQGYVLLTLIGVGSAFCASAIHTAADWVGELRFGICSGDESGTNHGYWLSKRLCCLESIVRGMEDECVDFFPWHEVVFGKGVPSAFAWMVDYFFYTILTITMVYLCAKLVQVYAPTAAGSGIPEVKVLLGGFSVNRAFGAWTLLIKSVGLVLSVGSGLNLGKEGPMAHVACCIGNVLSRFFPGYDNEVKKREIISASAAAGVSVAFGAPIGGVLFSLEEVSTYFPHRTMWQSFYCAIIGAMTLKFLDPFSTGKMVQFQVQYDKPWHYIELIPFGILGVLGGFIGVLFIEVNVRIQKLRRTTSLRKYPVAEAVSVAFITAIVQYNSVYLRGSATELLSRLFGDCRYADEHYFTEQFTALCDIEKAPEEIVALVMAGIIKLVLLLFTFGLRIPAGLFVPSLCVGACLGRCMGILVQLMHKSNPKGFMFQECAGEVHCITPGIYAIVGAAGVLGGVTRMTVSMVVIMFELTGGLEYIIPVMAAAITSKWVGDAFGRNSIYDRYIELYGYPFFDPKSSVNDLVSDAGEVMVRDHLNVISMTGHTLQTLETLLFATRSQGFPVVKTLEDMIVVGYIRREDLTAALSQVASRQPDISPDTLVTFARGGQNAANAQGANTDREILNFSDHLDHFPIQIVEHTPVAAVFDMFKGLGLRAILVQREGRLVGIIKKKDILAYMEHREQTRRGRMSILAAD